MAIKPIDTKAVHKITVDGTVFHARAWPWYPKDFWEGIRFRLLNAAEVAYLIGEGQKQADQEITEEHAGRILKALSGQITQEEADRLTDNIVDAVVEIEGIEDCKIGDHTPTIREFIDGMDRTQIMALAGGIHKHSSLDEGTVKNSGSSCDSSD